MVHFLWTFSMPRHEVLCSVMAQLHWRRSRTKLVLVNNDLKTQSLTRMHSCRMRTAHLLPVSPSMYLPDGCTWLGGWGWGGWCICPGGCTCLGLYLPRYSPPLWTEFLTHATENITLPQTSFADGNKAIGVHCLLLGTSLGVSVSLGQ